MIQTRDDRAVDLLALAVVVSVGLAAAPVTWRVLGRDDGRREVAAIAAALPEATVDLTPVKTFAPFGTRIAAGVTGDPTAANLQLRGVLLAHPAAASVALISAGGGPAKGFTIGATLPGGAILDAVEFDLVILRANGQLVTLALPIKSGTGTPTVTAPVAVLPVSGARPALPPTAAADPIEAYRARAQDPMSLLGTLCEAWMRAGGMPSLTAVSDRLVSDKTVRGTTIAAALALVTVMMGGVVAKWTGAAVACTGFPLCGPDSLGGAAQHIQLTHRVLAYLTALHVVTMAVLIMRRREHRTITLLAGVAASVVVLQIIFGALMVLGGFPIVIRSLHQATGVLLWVSTLALTYAARRAKHPPTEGAPVGATVRPRPPQMAGAVA